MKRNLIVLISFCLIGASYYLYQNFLNQKPETNLIEINPQLKSSYPFYSQKDPRWSQHQIGGSEESIQRVGCTLCCVAMSLKSLGIDETPLTLNQKLKRIKGYTDRGWLKWYSLVELYPKLKLKFKNNPSEQSIDDFLLKGYPIIVQINLKNGIAHWVLLVDKVDGEYFLHDPLDKTHQINKLSEYQSQINKMRVLYFL